MNRSDWSFGSPGTGGGSLDQGLVEGIVRQIAVLATNEEACKLLGVEGVLEGQLDLAFLNDPLEWLAEDIGNAIQATRDVDIDNDDATPEGESLTLDILVAEYRLCGLIQGSVDEGELLRRVRRSIEQRQGQA